MYLLDFATVKSLILVSKSIYMKQLFFVLFVAALLSACSGKQASSGDAKAATANKTVTLAVSGMTCTGCENTIQESVAKVTGVKSVKANHLDSTAVVNYDTTLTTIAAIGEAINQAGYEFKGEKVTTPAPVK